jgi:hypothetical protein
VPDFNFAKGSGKRTSPPAADTRRSASPPRQETPGREQRAADAQHPVPDPASPATQQHAAPAAGTSGEGGRPASVLDNYPERDLSHLTDDHGATPASQDETEMGPGTSGIDAYSDDDVADTAAEGDTASTGTEGGGKQRSGSRGPLLAFLSIIGILLVDRFHLACQSRGPN